jgi:hypothetical protein
MLIAFNAAPGTIAPAAEGAYGPYAKALAEMMRPAAYWSYLQLYSDGPHASDCYRRLAFLHASLEAPPDFSPVDYDVPPPPPEERIYIQHRVIFFGDPAYDLPPPRLHSVALG